MTTRKETIAPSQPGLECCMCGDYGLPNELFQCKACQTRSQHRYCSNLYPKAESYQICNWCLSQKEETKEKSQNSSNSSSSNKNQSEDDSSKNKKIGNGGNSEIQRGGNLQLKLNGPIKKQRSPEGSQSPKPPISPSGRKRLITNARLEEKLRRTKSEEISNRGGVTRQVFRNKVRRYKLLDEVSS